MLRNKTSRCSLVYCAKISEAFCLLLVPIARAAAVVLLTANRNLGINPQLLSFKMSLSAISRSPQFDLFSALPNELLLEILDSVADDYNARRKAFSVLSLVCHRFCSLATPLLYETFETGCNEQSELFRQSISARPELAGHVKRFVDRTKSLRGSKQRPLAYLQYADKPYANALERAAQLQVPEDVLRGISERYTPDLENLFLIAQCPNIEELEVTDRDFLIRTPLAYAARNLPLGLYHQFERLHTLSVTVNVWREYHFSALHTIFSLPTLRTLILKEAAMSKVEEHTWWHGDEKWDYTAKSSFIQELVLEQCGMDCIWLASAISACRTLRRFHCEFQHQIYRGMGGEHFYGTVGRALLEHSSSLEDVRINELNGCASFRHPTPVPLVSWEGCYALTYFDLPLYALLAPTGIVVVENSLPPGGQVSRTGGVPIDRVLPRSVCVLTVDVRAHREGASDQFFIDVADAAAQGYLKALSRVEVICRLELRTFGGLLPLHFCHLRRMFESQGVEFIYCVEMVDCEFIAGTSLGPSSSSP